MKCYNHIEKDAVVTCQCGRGLCQECCKHYWFEGSDGIRKVICKECYDYRQHKKDMINKSIKTESNNQRNIAYNKYLFMTIWLGFCCLAGLIGMLNESIEAVVWWGLGGVPAVFIGGFLGGKVRDAVDTSVGDGCLDGVLTFIVKAILMFFISLFLCPIVFVYSLIRTIMAKKL